LGDTAVAVNPEDERYKDLSGLYVLLPVLSRSIPVIFDKFVDTKFGTGALKITPAHDSYDFEIGNTHDLERVKVIDDDGKMNEVAGPYQGMDRFECREKILDDLKVKDLLDKIEPYHHAVGHCYRCKTMIEPILSKQWFVSVKPLADKAIAAVKEGKTRIIPTNWENVYFDWMYNIKDWCISRQIWWGHRIPAWYCQECGEVMVSLEAPEKCQSCKSDNLQQETDVLDTWFSSALWPFSTLGWPDQTDELTTFYPTSVLVTGFDILFFWVARMMMMGIHFKEDVPFRDVYIHALVRDAEGKKMSKSFGNVIDPLEVMDEFGTDAFRFTLAALAAQGRDIKLSEERISGYRHFVNKIWNSARLVLMNLEEDEHIEPANLIYNLPERWILTRLGQVSDEIAKALDEYCFNDAASLCYQFVWHEFCDWYLEMAKQGLYGQDEAFKQSSRYNLQEVLKAVLKLLHPFMPFVTEEIWQHLPHEGESLMIAPWPQRRPLDEEAELTQQEIWQHIRDIRNRRAEERWPVEVKPASYTAAGELYEALAPQKDVFAWLARVEAKEIAPKIEELPAGSPVVTGRLSTTLVVEVDVEKERQRLGQEMANLEGEIARSEQLLANVGFTTKAPPEVVCRERDKLERYEKEREKLREKLEGLRG